MKNTLKAAVCAIVMAVISVTALNNNPYKYVYLDLSGSTITGIGDFAFPLCTSLTSVTFEGTISSDNFCHESPFEGDLRTKYLAGGIGTYTCDNFSSTWTKQP